MSRPEKYFYYSTPRREGKSWVLDMMEKAEAAKKAAREQRKLAAALGVDEKLFKPLTDPAKFDWRRR